MSINKNIVLIFSLLKTKEICKHAVKKLPFLIRSVPDGYKNQEMCDRVDSEDPLWTVYCAYRYKTQRMCGEAVNDCGAALKFFRDRFILSKMLEKSDNALHAKDDLLFYNDHFDQVTFIANQRHILAVAPDKINVYNYNNFHEDDPDTIIHVRLLAWSSKFGKRKALKKI